MRNATSIDISENEILEYGDSLLDILLFDRTTRRMHRVVCQLYAQYWYTINMIMILR